MIAKPNALVYLRRNDLFIGGKRISAVKMKFTPNLMANLEVLDPDIFVTTCQEFFSTHGIKGKRVLLVLDQGIVFAKSIELQSSSKDSINEVEANFVAAMPFEQGQRACIHYLQNTTLQLYATNADLYHVIQESLRLIGIRKLIAITPAAPYKIDYAAKPNSVIDQFLDDKNVRRQYDFSTTSSV